MGNNITELVFILDRSGSMSPLTEDTIGGYNAMLERQQALEGKVYVSTVLFSNESTVLHDRLPLSEVKPLTKDDYCACGGTALLDAIGGAIHHIGNVHKYARPEDVPEHTIFIITTDGMENASSRYDSNKVKQMIRRQEERYNWEFMFFGANIDAIETAGNIGIRRERATNYQATSAGTRSVYATADNFVKSVREAQPITMEELDKLTLE